VVRDAAPGGGGGARHDQTVKSSKTNVKGSGGGGGRGASARAHRAPRCDERRALVRYARRLEAVAAAARRDAATAAAAGAGTFVGSCRNGCGGAEEEAVDGGRGKEEGERQIGEYTIVQSPPNPPPRLLLR
jgi:hypothetical protein